MPAQLDRKKNQSNRKLCVVWRTSRKLTTSSKSSSRVLCVKPAIIHRNQGFCHLIRSGGEKKSNYKTKSTWAHNWCRHFYNEQVTFLCLFPFQYWFSLWFDNYHPLFGYLQTYSCRLCEHWDKPLCVWFCSLYCVQGWYHYLHYLDADYCPCVCCLYHNISITVTSSCCCCNKR